jgi:hypothetical protein
VIKLEISAQGVAWYAAIVATFAFMVNAYSVLRDRPRLRVRFVRNTKMMPPDDPNDPTYYCITIANAGRKPITITHVGFSLKEGENDILLGESVRDGNREILPGHNTVYLARQDLIDESNLKYLTVNDGALNEYRYKVSRILKR